VTAADIVSTSVPATGAFRLRRRKKYGRARRRIEIDSFTIATPSDNLAKAGVGDRVRFLNQDLFETDISEATRW